MLIIYQLFFLVKQLIFFYQHSFFSISTKVIHTRIQLYRVGNTDRRVIFVESPLPLALPLPSVFPLTSPGLLNILQMKDDVPLREPLCGKDEVLNGSSFFLFVSAISDLLSILRVSPLFLSVFIGVANHAAVLRLARV